LIVEAHAPDAALASLSVAPLHAWVLACRVLVLRGFSPLSRAELLAFGRMLGVLLRGEEPAEGGAMSPPGAGDRDGVDHEVLMHWDRVGGHSPRYLIFSCEAAPGTGEGGETFFCDTTRVLASLRLLDRTVGITGPNVRGETVGPSVVRAHPVTGEAVLRCAEPLGEGITSEGVRLPELSRRLYHPAVCYVHSWRVGDVVVADNHALLHGRAAYGRGVRRRLSRVGVM
jgi:alpha-ketoglutarate-dependent taurine dioxygenase